MESIFYQGHRFLCRIKAFLDGRESVEDEPRRGRPCTLKTDENVTKVRDFVRSDRRLTVRMISCVLNLNRQTVHDPEKGFIVSGQRLRTLGCSLSHCHLRERIFGQTGYFSGSAATIFAWSEFVWLLPFPKTQIPPQRLSFWNCGQLRALLHEDFHHCYRKWEQRLRRCVVSQGNYFEGDNVDL